MNCRLSGALGCLISDLMPFNTALFAVFYRPDLRARFTFGINFGRRAKPIG